MITGKSKGLKKGDFVHTGAFPGIIISDVNTFAPCCEVWGFEHESGSAYASDIQKITREEFTQMAKDEGHSELNPYTKVAKDALAVAI